MPAIAASIALAPFENLSGDPSQDVLALGFVEDVASALSRFGAIEVVYPQAFAAAFAGTERQRPDRDRFQPPARQCPSSRRRDPHRGPTARYPHRAPALGRSPRRHRGESVHGAGPDCGTDCQRAEDRRRPVPVTRGPACPSVQSRDIRLLVARLRVSEARDGRSRRRGTHLFRTGPRNRSVVRARIRGPLAVPLQRMELSGVAEVG